MSTIWIVLLIIGSLIIVGLAFYAGKLLQQVKQQKLRQQQEAELQQQKLTEKKRQEIYDKMQNFKIHKESLWKKKK